MNRRKRIEGLRVEALPAMWGMKCNTEHIATCLGMTVKGVKQLARKLKLGSRKFKPRS